MLTFSMWRGDVSAAAIDAFDERLESLPEGFRRLLLPSLRHQAELLGIPPESVSVSPNPMPDPMFAQRPDAVSKAEIIVDGVNLYGVGIRPNVKSLFTPEGDLAGPSEVPHELWLYVVGPRREEGRGESVLRQWLEEAFATTLLSHSWRASRFSALLNDGRINPEMPVREEVAAAEVLRDRAARALAVAVKASSGLLVGDLEKPLSPADKPRTDTVRDTLVAAGIIAAETVVLCGKSGTQVARVPTASLLAALAKQGLKCACGRSIDEERPEMAFGITDLGRSLLDGSRWFTVLLLHELTSAGVPLERILVDQTVGGDEMDCIVDANGDLVFFELKDKEFNLGNAYSFGAKIGMVEPDKPVIVTTEHVGKDAKEHFSRSSSRRVDRYGRTTRSGVEVVYIEGIDALRPQLRELLSSIAAKDAAEVLGEFFPLGTLGSRTVLTLMQPVLASSSPS